MRKNEMLVNVILSEHKNTQMLNPSTCFGLGTILIFPTVLKFTFDVRFVLVFCCCNADRTQRELNRQFGLLIDHILKRINLQIVMHS